MKEYILTLMSNSIVLIVFKWKCLFLHYSIPGSNFLQIVSLEENFFSLDLMLHRKKL